MNWAEAFHNVGIACAAAFCFYMLIKFVSDKD